MRLPKTFTVETDRCRLRIVTKEDMPHIFSATRCPGFNDGMRWDPPAEESELEEPYEKNISAWENDQAYCFTIEEKESAEFIGRIAIRREEEKDVWSVGFWTHPRNQGKGFMSEVLPKIVNLACSSLGAIRIEACHALWNTSSKRVLEKAGMKFVCYIPQGFMKNGRWVEENLLAITKADWQQATE